MRIGAAPLAIGGDHTVPLPILRAIATQRPVGLIQFDAHGDVFDEFMGSKINHATFVRRGIEEGLIEPRRSIQIGLRGTRYGADDLDYSRSVGIRVVTIDDYEELGRDARSSQAIKEVGRQRPGLSHLRRRRARPDRGAGHRRARARRPVDARQPGHAAGALRPRRRRRRRLRGRAAARPRRPHLHRGRQSDVRDPLPDRDRAGRAPRAADGGSAARRGAQLSLRDARGTSRARRRSRPRSRRHRRRNGRP